MSEDNKKIEKETSSSEGEKYYFGGITEYKLEDIEAEVLNDNVYLDVFAGSDVRFKENIESFNGALNLISTIDVYKYNYKTEEFSTKNFPADEQIGMMAQDLGKILPQLVKEDEMGFGHVNYAGLSPILVSGIKELISITNKQALLIQNMESAIKNLELKLENQK